MSRRKDNKKKSRFLRFFVLPVIALAVIVGLVWWNWATITSWHIGVGAYIWRLFGGGIMIIVIALAVLVTLLAVGKQSSLVRRWNRWLALAAFLTTAWAVLGLAGAGGSIGIALTGGAGVLGGLKTAGLVALGLILALPHASIKLGRALVRSTFTRKRGQSDNRSANPKSKKGTVEGSVGSSPAPQPESQPEDSREDLRQVAQDVWKKYGKSSSLVTVDGWKLPPIDILDKNGEVEFSQADNQRRARLIEESLESYGVEARVVQINAGPTVTQFGIEPGWDKKMREIRERDASGNVRVRMEEVSRTRVKVERILSLANDLALSLAAPSIRIEAPVPGKSVVGIEVPNTTSSSVSVRGVIETSAFQKLVVKSKLAVALGKGAGGESVVADLAKMPHLLIAGATGSGKTVCLNTVVSCLLMNNAPTELRFIMIDPKRVELTPYNSIPHLASPVIVDTSKALGALRWLSQEMDRRYETFARVTVRNLEGYNKSRQGTGKLPYLVVIIDELADLMMAGFDEVERLLCRLAQLARATGIHLVVATQRPSVDVVTGLIKANFPTRISFAVTSQVDSRTILDTVGAEKLLGKGDMLFMPTEAAKPKRLQGCFVSDPEIERLVYFWNSQQTPEGASLRLDDVTASAAQGKAEAAPEDPLLETARLLAKEYKQVSASFLQRKLRIGYPRAARLMELLEEEKGGGGEIRSG